MMACPSARNYAFVLTLAVAGATGYYFYKTQHRSLLGKTKESDKEDDTTTFKVVFVLGGPGSGKGAFPHNG
jgi:hypothetical protein